jgi:V/A-type H+-transporting ATPase subunit E
MENLDTGKDKIKKIGEVLKNEILQPAKEEAQKILEVAEQEARNVIRDAEAKAEEIVQSAKLRVAKERELFDISIRNVYHQGIAILRQKIENELFNSELSAWVEKQSIDTELVAKLISSLVAAIEKEGTSVDFSAYIPSQVSPGEVNALLFKSILEKLRERSVVIGEFAGGVRLKLHDKHLTLDLSDEALEELIGPYIRKDFREILFRRD